MDDLEFNRGLFVRHDDRVFQIGLIITKYKKVKEEIGEFLFFANKDAIYEGFNFLSFVERYNDLNDFAVNWMIELKDVKSEADWFVHRSKLLTNLLCFRPVGQDIVADFRNKLMKNGDEEPAKAVTSAAMIWNHCLDFAEKVKYNPSGEPVLWAMWGELLKYKESKISEIKFTEKMLNKLDALIEKRKDEKTYKELTVDVSISINHFNYVNIMKEDFAKIVLKNRINSEMGVVKTIKKVLKI